MAGRLDNDNFHRLLVVFALMFNEADAALPDVLMIRVLALWQNRECYLLLFDTPVPPLEGLSPHIRKKNTHGLINCYRPVSVHMPARPSDH